MAGGAAREAEASDNVQIFSRLVSRTVVDTRVEHSIEFQCIIADFARLGAEKSNTVIIPMGNPGKNLTFEGEISLGSRPARKFDFFNVYISKNDLDVNTMRMRVLDRDDNERIVHLAMQSYITQEGSPPERSHFFFTIRRADILENPSDYLTRKSLVIWLGLELEEAHDSTPLVRTTLSEAARARFADGLTNTDLVLLCQDEEIACHKFVLGSCSDVMNSFFKDQNDTLESKTSSITIEDSTADSVRAFVKFLYTDEIGDEYDSACELIYLADKYNVKGLKRKCEALLVEKLSVENVAELAVLGKAHNGLQLKRAAVEFITKNKVEVMKSDAWSVAMKKDIVTISEIMMEIIEIM